MLNFDPHRWIAEHGSTELSRCVATVATVASGHAETEKSDLAKPGATVATSATLRRRHAPAALLREWHRQLSALDDCHAPAGFSIMWWQRACDDACWIYENFASRAARDSWSAHDLFGVLPWHPGWGGLCDRLQGARDLEMVGPKAEWSLFGGPEWTCAGAGDHLITSGLLLIWEMDAGKHVNAEEAHGPD